LTYDGVSIGKLVEDLSGGRLRHNRRVHLDPDLRGSTLPRKRGWRPIFGQGQSAAEAHLQKNGVTAGDLFLFFGRFREAERRDGRYSYRRGAPDIHIIFGWLQVGAVISCEQQRLCAFEWARYHPHFREGDGTAYISTEALRLGYQLDRTPGGGQFARYHDCLRLTAPDTVNRRVWQMPPWFYPRRGRCPLTYHPHRASFKRSGSHVILHSAARGQEFILDTRYYPEAIGWARKLIQKATNAS
jgi:hypothetical protein